MINTKKFLLLFIFISFVLVVVGSTFSYFTATISDSNSVKGNAIEFNYELAVTLASSDATGNLVPQLDSTINSAIKGTNNKSCVDGNGNTVCKVYKISIINNGPLLKISGKIELSSTENSTFSNLKWAIVDNISNNVFTTGSVDSVNDTATTSFVVDGEVSSKSTNDYYLVIWISETNSIQNEIDKGSFVGTVTVGAGNSIDGVSSVFSG